MKSFLSICCLCFCFFSCKENKSRTEQNQIDQKPNILLICVDDLRPELNSFGASYIVSPHIDGLAKKGISYKKHYVNAPSCGPSRYTLLTGLYGPPSNNALFQRAKKLSDSSIVSRPSMPEWFKSHGYKTISVGKVSHHPGGRGGKDWNDSTVVEMPYAWDRHLMPVGEWKHPRGAMHGLANGEIREKANEMDVFQAAEGVDVRYPDDLIIDEARNQLHHLATNKDQPFFLAVGILKPHLPFGAPKEYYDLYGDAMLPKIGNTKKPEGRTTWHDSFEFMKYNRWEKDPNKDVGFAEEVRRHYAACVTYADAQVGRLLNALKESGVDKNTIVVLWGDHGWHLGEHAIWGKHSLFEESLHAPLIIYDPKDHQDMKEVNAIVETIDIFPTLCELTKIKTPEFVKGTSLLNVSATSESTSETAIAYTSKAQTIRNKTHRLILHEDGYIELYDHTSENKETVNIAYHNPKIVEELTDLLKTRL